MIALGTDHIIAREGTITGSIGVLVESAEVSELINKIGIKPIIIKSKPLKGTPSMFEKSTPESNRVLQDVIDDFYDRFVDMVAERRKLPRDSVITLADGRVYSGRRAVEQKLIDAIGGEQEAVKWLVDQKHIAADLPIENVEIKKEMDIFSELTQSVIGKLFQSRSEALDGISAIWHPRLY
jgi:protease-4